MTKAISCMFLIALAAFVLVAMPADHGREGPPGEITITAALPAVVVSVDAVAVAPAQVVVQALKPGPNEVWVSEGTERRNRPGAQPLKRWRAWNRG